MEEASSETLAGVRRKHMKFKWLYVAAAIVALGFPIAAAAQPSTPEMSTPEMPTLTPEQSEQVRQQITSERATMEARVGRGEVTPDEAERFLAWREWQIARQVTGTAPPSTTVQRQVESPPPRHGYAPAPYYYGPAPYYYGSAPYYYGPAPYYWGPRWGATICAGSWGHHVGGSLCF